MQQLFNTLKQNKFHLVLILFITSLLQVGQMNGMGNPSIKVAFAYPDQKDWVYVDIPYNPIDDTVKTNDLINKAAEVFHLNSKQLELMFLQKKLVKNTNISAKKLQSEGIVRVTKITSKAPSRPAQHTPKSASKQTIKIAFVYSGQKDWVYVDIPYNPIDDTVKTNDLINKAAEVFHLNSKQLELMFLQEELVKNTNISAKKLQSEGIVRVTKITSKAPSRPISRSRG
jgi:hypothetical protein